MKELDMIRLNDIPDEPSAELNARTLAAMRAAEEKKTQRKVPAWRKIAVCAAMFCAALVLMGAGVRVFEYLTFVPGMGIVTADQAEVYTLERVVEAGNYRIEAASMIPADDEEHEGMWKITVLTDIEVPKGYPENPDLMKPMSLVTEEGETVLRCSGGSGIGARFDGYAEINGAGDYILKWNGKEQTVTMKSMENSVWADYSYPIDQGMTVILFPLAEGSQYMVMDVILDPQSENMMYWASHCDVISYQPEGITVYDTEGNTYSVPSRRGSGVRIPESEMDYGVNSLLSYRIERILTLDRIPEAPIARVTIEDIRMEMLGVSDDQFYTPTVPEFGETVAAENLPNGGVFYDNHGLKIQIKDASYTVDELNNNYALVLNSESAQFEFSENVWQTLVFPAFIRPDAIGTAKDWEYYRGATTSHFDRETMTSDGVCYVKDIVGFGDMNIRNGSIDVNAGDEIAMCIDEIVFMVDGSWTIDFTAPAETAE
ncbi:MAG: hypothetical protein IKI93_03455 [Clostridia bacterium]|nr:hypothetical protein [Clostridia bacterium]